MSSKSRKKYKRLVLLLYKNARSCGQTLKTRPDLESLSKRLAFYKRAIYKDAKDAKVWAKTHC